MGVRVLFNEDYRFPLIRQLGRYKRATSGQSESVSGRLNAST
jgi:hypothetical protein